MIFETIEALASCALDFDVACVTVSEGLTRNPKLHRIKVIVRDRTGEIVWRGAVSHVTREFIHQWRCEPSAGDGPSR